MGCCLEIKHNITLLPDGDWRLQIWTSKADGVDPNIFVYQRKPDVPFAGSDKDFFVNIAQVADLEEYPADAPNDQSSFFRLPYMDVKIRSPYRLDVSLDKIQRDLDDLVKSIDEIGI